VLEALAWGLIAASSLLVGAVVAFTVPMGRRPLGLIMAFGSGVLVSAVAYDLVEEAVAASAAGVAVAIGFAAGALVFFVGDELIEKLSVSAGPADGTADGAGEGAGDGEAAGGLAVLLGAVLDGIPESIVIGVSLISGGRVSVAVLVAVFISNVPEAIYASTALRRSGIGRGRILGLWAVVVGASGLAAAVGYGALDEASGDAIALSRHSRRARS
jgi:ZIP family zinc transporter